MDHTQKKKHNPSVVIVIELYIYYINIIYHIYYIYMIIKPNSFSKQVPSATKRLF